MKYYILKFKDETLDDVFDGSQFTSCLRTSKRDIRTWANNLYKEIPDFDLSYEIIELNIKSVEKGKKRV